MVGRVVNAINKAPVPNARIGIAATRLCTHSDAAGYFRLVGAPTGKVPLEVSADGFSAEQLQRELTAGRETSVRVALSPRLEKGQIRIVLTWGQQPKDLDAHLEGPLPGGQRFHVYYHQPDDLQSQQFVRLDTDAQNGEGPETITALAVLPGTYRYFVHDYTNRDNTQSTALANSGAEVRIYQGGESCQFHAGHDMVGNLWDVCTIEVTADGATVKKTDNYQGVKVAALGLYDKRTLGDRPQWIGHYGGSTRSEQAVDEGLQWLVRHQAADGSWSSRCLGKGSQSRCDPADRCTDEGAPYEMAQTGLALLALQAGGHYYFNQAKYSEAVRKGLDWLVSRQRADGALLGSQPRSKSAGYHRHYMYEHGMAAFALADACAAAAAFHRAPGVLELPEEGKGDRADLYEAGHRPEVVRQISPVPFSRQSHGAGHEEIALARETHQSPRPSSANHQYIAEDNKYRRAAEKAVAFIEKQQHDDGGWRYTPDPKAASDTSVTGWPMLALKSAQQAGISVSRLCVEKMRKYFEEHQLGSNGRTGYQRRGITTDATTGVGMLARQFMLQQPDVPLVAEAAKYLASQAEARWGGRQAGRADTDYYLWYNCSLAMFQVGGELWDRWNNPVRDAIIALQRHEGCQCGSWDPSDRWGRLGGRIYSTALAILTLEVYYRYAPQRETHEPFHFPPGGRDGHESAAERSQPPH